MKNTNTLFATALFALGLFSFAATAEPSEQLLAQTLVQEADCCGGNSAADDDLW